MEAINALDYKPRLILINGNLTNKPIKKSNKQAGVSSEVYAFKTKEEINSIIEVLNNNITNANDNDKKQIAERNKLLFVLGINLGIRASDLRTLKFSFFLKSLNGKLIFKDSYIIQPKKQRKQGKFVELYFNDIVKLSIKNYLEKYPIDTLDTYVFESRKKGSPIIESSIWRIIKDIAKKAGIIQNIGSHSLRKTWGYWVWHEAKDKNKMLVILQKCFNHSSTETTIKYIGLLQKEIENAYLSINLGMENLKTIN